LTELAASDISVIVQTLLGNNAKTISQGIEGADKFGTAPIRNSYWALCDSDLTSDMNDVDGFTHAANYPQQKNILLLSGDLFKISDSSYRLRVQ